MKWIDSFMRVSCAEDKTVTIYFDLFSKVIIHWYGSPHFRREFIGKRETKGKSTGDKTMG